MTEWDRYTSPRADSDTTERNKRIERMVKQGCTTKQIGARVGLRQTSVADVLRRLGFTFEHGKGWFKDE